MKEGRCIRCGARFKRTRDDAKYCSSRCCNADAMVAYKARVTAAKRAGRVYKPTIARGPRHPVIR
jgi:hypothetical protein